MCWFVIENSNNFAHLHQLIWNYPKILPKLLNLAVRLYPQNLSVFTNSFYNNSHGIKSILKWNSINHSIISINKSIGANLWKKKYFLILTHFSWLLWHGIIFLLTKKREWGKIRPISWANSLGNFLCWRGLKNALELKHLKWENLKESLIFFKFSCSRSFETHEKYCLAAFPLNQSDSIYSVSK